MIIFVELAVMGTSTSNELPTSMFLFVLRNNPPIHILSNMPAKKPSFVIIVVPSSMFNLRKNLFSIKYAPSLLGLFNFDRLRAIAEQEKDTEKCARNIYANDLTHDKKRGFL